MKISAIASALFIAAASAAAIPEAASSKALEARQQTGSYTIAGLGARKKQVTAAGASFLNMAVAMLETEKMDTNVSNPRSQIPTASTDADCTSTVCVWRQQAERRCQLWNLQAKLGNAPCVLQPLQGTGTVELE